jgi:hypothetical protein
MVEKFRQVIFEFVKKMKFKPGTNVGGKILHWLQMETH